MLKNKLRARLMNLTWLGYKRRRLKRLNEAFEKYRPKGDVPPFMRLTASRILNDKFALSLGIRKFAKTKVLNDEEY